MKLNQSACDDDQLLTLLCAADGSSDAVQIANHVEQCGSCQRRIEELAGSHQDWEEAGDLLAQYSRVSSEDDGQCTHHWSAPRLDVGADFSSDAPAETWLPAGSHPEMLGRIGRYDVERLIGSGGMGVVFKAYDTELNRPVAVKLLAPFLASSGAARNRFAREARAAAAVIDDHVVPIHNVETDGELSFLVMKCIAGGSLQQRLDREGALEVCEVLRIGMQIAKGLAAAHAQGLIHRDVKPSNVLLDEGVERALLTDFGLARATDDASLTRSGCHPGTPHYMSPEQVRGEVIDARSDLFGLGCVLYALCTGHPPFRSDTSFAVMRRITDDSPRPIRETNADVPQWLEDIVLKLLAKSPDDRFESAGQVAELLEQCLAHVQHPATPLPEFAAASAPSRNRRPPNAKFIAAAAFSFSLLFAGVLVVMELNKGTLTIESEVDGVSVRILKGSETVRRLKVDHTGESVRIAAGQYVVEIDGKTDSIELRDGRVSLSRGEEVIARIVHAPDPSDAAPPSPSRTVDFVLGESSLVGNDQIEIRSIVSSGNGFEVGATVTVKGAYSLDSVDAADLCFFSTVTLRPGERPVGTPVQSSQRVKAKRGRHAFTLSKVIRGPGSPHVTFYSQTTGQAIGGLYFRPTVGNSKGESGINNLPPASAPSLSQVFAELDGEVVETFVEQNSVIKQGQTLLRLRNSDLALQLAETSKQIQQTRAELERIQDASQNSNDVQPADRTQLAEQQAAARSRLRRLRKRQNQINEQIESLVIRSPVAGTVVTQDVGKILDGRPVRKGQVLLEIAPPVESVSARSNPSTDTRVDEPVSSEFAAAVAHNWPELEGVWLLASQSRPEWTFPAFDGGFEGPLAAMTLHGNLRLLTNHAGKTLADRFVYDPNASPATIDFMRVENGKPRTIRGIIEINDNRLRLAASMDGGSQRPESFDKTRSIVLDFQRVAVPDPPTGFESTPIKTAADHTNDSPPGHEDSTSRPQHLPSLRRALRSVVTVHCQTHHHRQGQSTVDVMEMIASGVIVDERGYIITTDAVVEDANSIIVSTSDGMVFVADYVASDPQTGVALIKIHRGSSSPVIPIRDSVSVRLGEPVQSIVGAQFGRDPAVTRGVVTALNRNVDVGAMKSFSRFIQTDAGLVPGSAGGPLLDGDSKLIGINVAIRAGARPVSFAIPSDQVIASAQRMIGSDNNDTP